MQDQDWEPVQKLLDPVCLKDERKRLEGTGRSAFSLGAIKFHSYETVKKLRVVMGRLLVVSTELEILWDDQLKALGFHPQQIFRMYERKKFSEIIIPHNDFT